MSRGGWTAAQPDEVTMTRAFLFDPTQRRLVLLVATCAALTGCHLIYPFAASALDGGGRDSASADSAVNDITSAGDLPSTGKLTCQGYTMPAFSKACAARGDCVIVTHTINCCGTKTAIGLAAKDRVAFGAEEAICDATYPKCGCATGPTQTDDGSSAPFSAGAIAVDCVAGVCTTYVADCGKPCVGGQTCHSCSPTAGGYAVCSSGCTVDNDCTKKALPSCLTGWLGMFCAASPDSCAP
jgi:hypothetical protein